MKELLINFIKSEIFMYLLMGVLTTVVNIVTFNVLCKLLKTKKDDKLTWKIAEIVAFIVAVIFAFITNKIFVFKSLDFTFLILIKELGEFFVARIITEVINFAIMWYMIDKKNCNEMLTKILASVIVVALNYIFSKFIIFR